jgi:diacylglycerol diphosphate phosphatase/phosphatidate phosphatase
LRQTKAWLSVLPLYGAALVAVSRTMDYRRKCLFSVIQVRMLTYVLSPDHWQDVLAGSLLGVVTALFAYRQYFRALTSRVSHLPYLPRTQRPEGTHDHPAPGLPFYRTLQRSADREGDEAEVELIRGAVRRGEPVQLERGWEHGPSV